MDNIQYRTSLHLIIERTLNGLDYDYVSAALNRNELERLQLSFDETSQVGQFNEGYCYSVRRTAKHSVYSIINTSMKDNAKRNGFFAIRLIVKKDEYVERVMHFLSQLTAQYIEYLKDGGLSTQNYDNVLQEIGKNIKSHDSVAPQSEPDKMIFYDFLDLTLDQSEAFNNPKLQYANKVYFLDERSKHQENVAIQFGFQPLQNLLSKTRKIHFENTTSHGLKVKVNDEEFSLGEDTFLICKIDDRIQYKLTFDRHFKDVSIFEGEILVKPDEVEFVKPCDSSKKVRQGSAALVGAWIIGPIIGVVVGYFTIDPILNYFGFKDSELRDASSPVIAHTDDLVFGLDTTKRNVLFLVLNDSIYKNHTFCYRSDVGEWQFYKNGDEASIAPLNNTTLKNSLNGADHNDTTFLDKIDSLISIRLPKLTKIPVAGSENKAKADSATDPSIKDTPPGARKGEASK